MAGITGFLVAHAPNPWIMVSVLSFGPISESRGGIIYGMLAGLDPAKVFFVSVALNILAIPFIFWLLSISRTTEMMRRATGKKINCWIERNNRYFEKHAHLGILALVALPFPGAGAWTGAIVADFLGIQKNKSFFVIAAGVIIAAATVFLGAEIFAREAWAFK